MFWTKYFPRLPFFLHKGHYETLITVAAVIEAKGQEDAKVSLFEPTVQGMFSAESQREAHKKYIKEDLTCSTELKIKVLEALEPKSWLSKICLNIQKRCSCSCSQTVNATLAQSWKMSQFLLRSNFSN